MLWKEAPVKLPHPRNGTWISGAGPFKWSVLTVPCPDLKDTSQLRGNSITNYYDIAAYFSQAVNFS